MEGFILVTSMIAIGAIIGGFTNSIAIKMLFRPYNPIYIGKRRLPFTPGLIPKRRGELAEQLGHLVVNHLLTADALKQKVTSSEFNSDLTKWLQSEATNVFKSNETLDTLLDKWCAIGNSREKLEKLFDHWFDEQIMQFLQETRSNRLNEIVPLTIKEKIEEILPILATRFVQKGTNYINSDEGREMIRKLVESFLADQGTMGNMVSMFLGSDRLVDKFQPELIKYVNDTNTHKLILDYLDREVSTFLEMRVEEFEQLLDIGALGSKIRAIVKRQIPFYYIEQPFSQFSSEWQKRVVNDYIPLLVTQFGQFVSEKVPLIMEKLKVEQVVTNQVEQLSVKRLEEMVLSISKKEFTLIKYLGALLGGAIGLIQGLLLLFIR